MIDPNWSVVDLDPRTWRNLGRFIEPLQYVRAAQPGEQGLFVLHDQGRLMKVFDTAQGVRKDLKIDRVTDARALAQQLYARGEWDRIHIIDKQHLARVGYVSGAAANRSLHLDGYYQLVNDLIWDGSEGYVAVPPKPDHWNHWTMSRIEEFVSRLPKSAAVALGVFDDAQLNIGLVLEFKQGNIVRVTTFEAPALQPIRPQLSKAFLDELWQQLSHIAPAAAVLLCTQAVFAEWITTPDKGTFLLDAIRRGGALLKLADI